MEYQIASSTGNREGQALAGNSMSCTLPTTTSLLDCSEGKLHMSFAHPEKISRQRVTGLSLHLISTPSPPFSWGYLNWSIWLGFASSGVSSRASRPSRGSLYTESCWLHKVQVDTGGEEHVLEWSLSSVSSHHSTLVCLIHPCFLALWAGDKAQRWCLFQEATSVTTAGSFSATQLPTCEQQVLNSKCQHWLKALGD